MNIKAFFKITGFAFCLFAHNFLSAQTPGDSAGIRNAALDYIEGWYTGDATRMERALHPELAKRALLHDNQGNLRLDQMSAMTLVEETREGHGKGVPVNQQQKDFSILDIYGNAACAKVIAKDWIDYLQLIKVNGEWKIINVLWELKHEK